MLKTEVYWIEGPWRGRLGIGPRPRGGDWLEDEIQDWRKGSVEIVVSLLTPEEIDELGLALEPELCRQAGIQYISFPIPDRDVPESVRTFALLLTELETALAQGKGMVIHCRQGVGRSALLAAGLLVSSGMSAAEALSMTGRARGCPVPDTKQQEDWLVRFTERVAAAPRKA